MRELRKIIADTLWWAFDRKAPLHEQTNYLLNYLFNEGYGIAKKEKHPLGGYIAVAVTNGHRVPLGRYTVDDLGRDVLYLGQY